jgi:hypothetical protein
VGDWKFESSAGVWGKPSAGAVHACWAEVGLRLEARRAPLRIIELSQWEGLIWVFVRIVGLGFE